MAIFDTIFESSNNFTTDVLDEEMAKINLPDVSETIAEPDVGDDIVKEYVEASYNLEAAMYVADIQLESAAYCGESVEIVTENVLTDALNKAKEYILKLWNKIREWIRKMTASLKSFASASTLFIKKHESQINTRFSERGEKYQYTGYEYDENTLSSALDNIKSLESKARTSGGDAASSSDMGVLYAEIGRTFASGSNAYSLSELGSAITKACRGKEQVDAHPTDTQVKTWIKTVKDSKATLNDLMKAELATKQAFEKIIANLKKSEKEAKKNDKDATAENIHNSIKFNQTMASIVSKITTVVVNCRCEQYKAYSKRLKEIYNLKETEKEKATEGYGLLDAAFSMI